MKAGQSKNNTPKNWEGKNLSSLLDIKRGGSPRPIEEYITNEEDGLNWLKIGDVKAGSKYIVSTSSKILRKGLSKTILVKPGDFILSNSMSFGRPYILKIETCIHDGWLAFQNIDKNQVDRVFLYHLLLHPNTQSKFSSISAGSGVRNLKKETVGDIRLLLPPLPEQERIVAVLDTWDRTIEKLSRKIEIKKRIKKGLMQELLTSKVRLAGFEQDWTRMRIGSFATLVSTLNIKNKPYEVLSCTKNHGLVRSLEYFKRRVYGDNLKKYKIAPKDSFVYATNHIEEGSIGYQDQVDYGLVSPMYTIFQTHNVDNRFLIRLLKTPRLIFEYKKHMSASVDRRGGLRWDQFSKIKITLPSLSEQTAIANILTAADEEIETLEKKLGLLKAQKTYLLNNLVTGAIRTPENITINKPL